MPRHEPVMVKSTELLIKFDIVHAEELHHRVRCQCDFCSCIVAPLCTGIPLLPGHLTPYSGSRTGGHSSSGACTMTARDLSGSDTAPEHESGRCDAQKSKDAGHVLIGGMDAVLSFRLC